MQSELPYGLLGDTYIVVGGPVGANKRRIADKLHERIGKPEYRFANYLKGIATQRGMDENDNTVLQDLGQEVIDVKPWEAFCHAVLGPRGKEDREADVSDAAAPVDPRPRPAGSDPYITTNVSVVDGVRHVLAVRTLRQLAAPADTVVIYVDADRGEQFETLRERGNSDKKIKAILQHPVEAESGLVKLMSDFTLKYQEEVETVVGDIKEILEKGRQRALEEIQTKTGIARDQLIHWRDTDIERYETLREVVLLLRSVAGDDSIMRWLRTPQPSIRAEKPLDAISYGYPKDAIVAAVDTVQNP